MDYRPHWCTTPTIGTGVSSPSKRRAAFGAEDRSASPYFAWKGT
jgi:hypothetical protein